MASFLTLVLAAMVGAELYAKSARRQTDAIRAKRDGLAKEMAEIKRTRLGIRFRELFKAVSGPDGEA